MATAYGNALLFLYSARFDLADCLLDYKNSVTIHGDDVLAHANWEINEKWLRKYQFVSFINLDDCY